MKNTPEGWTERAKTFADSAQATGWSRKSQRLRFQQIVFAISPAPGESLLDFGCGTGELLAYLPDGINYIGVDWSIGMLERAQSEHPGANFQTHLPEGTWDLTVVAGTFNLTDNWSKEQTWNSLESLWQRTRRAMAVALNATEDTEIKNMVYTEIECQEFAAKLTPDWGIVRWRPADILLALYRS